MAVLPRPPEEGRDCGVLKDWPYSWSDAEEVLERRCLDRGKVEKI